MFVDPLKDVKNTLDHVSLSLLQFHGNETLNFVRVFHTLYKSIPMSVGTDIEKNISNGEVIKKYQACIQTPLVFT